MSCEFLKNTRQDNMGNVVGDCGLIKETSGIDQQVNSMDCAKCYKSDPNPSITNIPPYLLSIITPSFARQAVNFISEISNHILNGAGLVSNQVWLERLQICEGCPLNNQGICSLCGCPVENKTRLATSSCPAIPPKWIMIEDSPAPSNDCCKPEV